MSDIRSWLLAALTGALLSSAFAFFVPSPATVAAPPAVGPGDWRYHDGHWNYWDPSDKRWYYTDGRNWYTYQEDTWRPYTFDRHYGRQHFHRGEYRVPGPGVQIEVPQHRIYVGPD